MSKETKTERAARERTEQLIASAGQINDKIKALEAELEPFKTELKEIFEGQFGTFQGAGPWQVLTKPVRTLNKARALKWGKKVTERVVTANAIKLAVERGDLTQEQANELYDAGKPSLEFKFTE